MKASTLPADSTAAKEATTGGIVFRIPLVVRVGLLHARVQAVELVELLKKVPVRVVALFVRHQRAVLVLAVLEAVARVLNEWFMEGRAPTVGEVAIAAC